MAVERRGQGVAVLALLVSLVALAISILAYQKATGGRGMEEQVRALQAAVEVARKETADALARIERAVRPPEGARGGPGETKR